MRIEIINNKINLEYQRYSREENYDILKLESLLLEALSIKADDTENLMKMALVQLSEPILDYERAHSLLSIINNDIRAFLLSSYIENWYFGYSSNNRYSGDLNFKSNEMSSLYYYYSLNDISSIEKIGLLEKSIKLFRFNFLSIIEYQKELNKNQNSHYNVDSRTCFNECVDFIYKLNNTKMIDKQLLYKPFFYSRILGLNRTNDNLLTLKNTLFK